MKRRLQRDTFSFIDACLRPTKRGEIGLDDGQLICEFNWWYFFSHRVEAHYKSGPFVLDALQYHGYRRQRLVPPYGSYRPWKLTLQPGRIMPARNLVTEAQLQLAFEHYRAGPWQRQKFKDRFKALGYATFRYHALRLVDAKPDPSEADMHYIGMWKPARRSQPKEAGTLYVISQRLPGYLLARAP